MATITSVQSGNWSDTDVGTSPWLAGITPNPALDTVIIAVSHVVVLDDSRTIPPTTVEGSLTQANGVTTTLGGVLTVGNGTSKDGTFTFGAGSVLALGANNVTLANCSIRSNSTSGSWAEVTGSGAFVTSGTYTSPKQSIQLAYVSFQNTGAITFAISTSTGSITSLFDVQKCTFVGTGALAIGKANGVNVATTLIFDYNDVRNPTGNVTFDGSYTANATWADAHANYNTWFTSTARTIGKGFTDGFQFIGNVVDGFGWTAIDSGGHTITANLFTYTSATAPGTPFPGSYKAPGDTISGNYYYSPSTWENPHFLTGTAAYNAAGTGTCDVSDNVFEMVNATGDGGNAVYSFFPSMNVHNNIMIGAGKLANIIGNVVGTLFATYNNTVWVKTDIASWPGNLEIWENGNHSGTVDIYNNIQSGVTTASTISKSGTASSQALRTLGYNNNHLVTTPYPVASVASISDDQTSHDLAVDPLFFDNTRDIATWNESQGGGTESGADAVAYLLRINGYNSTTKKQSDSSVSDSPNSLLVWVRTGFVPTNADLATAGVGGAGIGAMYVATETVSDSEPGTALVTGLDATGTRAYVSATTPGTTTATGANTADYIGYRSDAQAGSVSTTGADSTGVYTPVGSTTSTAQPGVVAVLGVNASGIRTLISLTEPGAVNLTGVNASGFRGLLSVTETGALAVTGNNATDVYTHGEWTSNALPGALAVSGYAAESTTTKLRRMIPVTRGREISAASGRTIPIIH